MAKIIYASLTTNRRGGRSRAAESVPMKSVLAPDGSMVEISSVDADSPTFSSDLTVAFRRNVARSRRENEQLIADADLLARGT